MQNTQTSNSLSRAQVESYWENGFLCPIPAISALQCEDWREELEAIESTWLDNAKAKFLLDWKPKIDLKQLIEKAWGYERAGDDPRKIWYPG